MPKRPSLERRLAAEGIGTALLVMAVVGSGAMAQLLTRDVAVQREDGAGRQVINQRRGRVEEQRQVVLKPAGGDAVADVLVQRRLGWIALERLAKPPTEARAGCFVERKLASRQQADFGHRIERALRVDVEALDALDVLVVPRSVLRAERRARHADVEAVFAAHRVA